MAAGSVIVDLLLRTGSFESDTQRASKNLKQFQKDAEAAGKAVGLAFAAAATGAVAGLAALVTNTINANDHLNDLSKKTGIAVDTLGGIGFAASQAGGDIESAAVAAGKLNKSLAEAAAGNKQAAEAFDVLGISVKNADGSTKSADKALAEIADKFATYADGPEKAALALRIFGKAGADIIPLLDDGGKALLENIEYFKRYSGVTKETGADADQFNDTLGKIKLLSGAFGQQLASSLLPTLQGLADLWLKNKEQGDGFHGTAEKIAEVFKGLVIGAAFAGTAIATIGDQIGAFLAQLGALARLDFKGFAEIGHESTANLDKAKKDFGDFYDAIYNGKKKADSAPDPITGKKGGAPRLSGGGAAPKDTAGAELKKQLDGQLRLIQDFEKNQAAAYSVGQSYLEGVYQDGLIKQSDYFQAQRNLRDANLANTLDAIDKEIAAQRAFIASPAAKPADRVAAEEKIKLAVQQRADAITKASASNILAAQPEARATQQLQDAYANLQAQVLANSGNDFAAAQIKNAQAVRDARELIAQAGGDPALADKLAGQLTQQAQANQLQKDYAKLLDETSRREQEIYLNAQIGGKSELETLAAIRDARQVVISQLREQARAAAELAATPFATDADIKRANDLALALKKASAEIDPLAAKFNGTFEEAGANAFESFIDGSKSATQAARDFGKSVLAEFNKLASKDLAKMIFGSGGESGGLGGFFSSLFKGSSAPSASTGGGASGAGNGNTIGSLISLFSGFFADGGYIPPGQWGMTGERGPEPVFGGRTGVTVQPNTGSGGARSTVVNNQFNVVGPVDRRAERQIAFAAGRGVDRANSRYA